MDSRNEAYSCAGTNVFVGYGTSYPTSAMLENKIRTLRAEANNLEILLDYVKTLKEEDACVKALRALLSR